MKLRNVIVLLLCLFLASTTTQAQKLLPGFNTFSKKKTAYITLNNGTTIEGTILKISRKKGLLEEIKIKNAKGKKQKITPDKIKHMYLPPSGWDKFAKSYDFIHDASKWDNTDLDQDIIGKGYAYFERSDVMLKKKKKTLLLQLLNPSFSSKIKVYYDPYAKETMSIGVGPVTAAGGNAKSYFIKKGKKVAYKLKKKKYKEDYKALFGDCKSVMSKFGKKKKWGELAETIFAYNTCK